MMCETALQRGLIHISIRLFGPLVCAEYMKAVEYQS
ncbi:MAG: hypothetical protein QOJ64_1192 [Acidobacteriota bacterium]|jgi:hypothetical protein|nr:hypothetical protein [Acidobacteriota bacterium]